MIKIKFLHYWIELPDDLELIELAKVLAHAHLKLVWNRYSRHLEVTRK